MRNTTLTHLYMGGALGWVDATADARQGSADSGGGHTITRVPGDPGTMDLVLDNTAGRYSPRNWRSPYFGLLGRNTPVRFGLELLAEQFGTPAAAGWGAGWTSFGAGGTVAPADSTVSAGMARHWVPLANAYRANYYSARRFRDCEVRFTVDMVTGAVTGAPIEPANVMLRMQDLATYYMARVEVSATEVVTVSLHHSVTGVIASAAVVAGLTFAGQPLTVAASCVGDRLAVKVWDPAAGGEPVGWHRTAVDGQVTAAGYVGIRSGVAAGNTNTLPIEFRYDDLQVIDWRAHMEVSEWPSRWNTRGTVTWVPVQAAGILRRLKQGAKPLDSALYRYLSRTGPSGYWPLEDPAGSLEARSAVEGVPGMTTFGYSRFTTPGSGGKPVPAANLPAFGSGDGIPGSAPVVDLAQGGVLQASLPPAGAAGWRVEWVMRSPRDKGATVIPIRWATDGTWNRWDIQIEATGIFATFGTDSSIAGTAGATLNLYDGLPHHFQVEAFNSAGNVDVRIYVDDLLVSVYSLTGGAPMPGTAGSITQVIINPLEIKQNEAASTAMPIMGHVAVWNPSSGLTDTTTAMRGHAGEQAGDRVARLCAEQGVPVYVSAVPSAAMGPQRPAKFLELLGDAADADGGILTETREHLALTYRCRSALYNRIPTALDYTHLTYLEPTDDDDQVRNDVEVKRPDGGRARAVQLTGPLSVLDPPAGVGTYDMSVTLNLESDGQLTDHAGWRRHLGTWDAARYPKARVNLAGPVWVADLELADQVTALAAGDVVSLAGLPDWLPAGPVLSMVRGSIERVDQHERVIEWIWTPAGPYMVAAASGPQRVPIDGSTLAAALTGTPPAVTVWDFTAGSGVLGWSTIGGSVAISGGALLFTPNGATASVEARSPNTPVVALSRYAATATATCPVTRTVTPLLIWRDAAGALLSSSSGPPVAVTANVPTAFTATADAPAGATQAQVSFSMGGTPPTTNTLSVDVAQLAEVHRIQLASAPAGARWTTKPSAFPLDLLLGGAEQVTVSAITAGTPQVADVVARSVNGVVKAWPAGTSVQVYAPAVVPL